MLFKEDRMSKQYVACVGRMHSGKDVVCEQIERLVAPDTVEFIRFSDPLGNSLRRMKAEMLGCAEIVLDREHYQNYSTNLREEFDPDILANWVQRKALASAADWVLVMGMRKLQDLPAMRKLTDCTIVSVEASQELRLLWTQRSMKKKGLRVPTRQQFIALDGQECEVDIDELAKSADWHIYNDKDDHLLGDIRNRVELFLKMLRA